MLDQTFAPISTLDDATLLTGARDGDSASVAELYRRHINAAERFAAGLVDPARASDVVADAMMKVFALLERGSGPTTAFRAYLFSTIRTVAIDSFRKQRKETLVDDVTVLGEAWAESDVEHSVEHADVIGAFKSLPERSQKALWLSVVEGRPLEEVGEELGLNANAVAALTFRARETLRQGYLAQHLGTVKRAECERYTDHLPKHVRGKLRGKTKREVEEHVEHCHDCAIAATTLGSINTRLHALLIPAALVGVLPFVTPEVAQSAQRAEGNRAGTGSDVGGWQKIAAWGSVAAAAGALAAGAWWLWPDSAPEDKGESTPTAAPAKPGSVAVSTAPAHVDDPAVGAGTVAALGHVGAGWAHVDVPLVADERATVLVSVSGASEALIHSDPQHGQWACEEQSEARLRFVCQVPAGQLASTSLGIDVSGTGTAAITISVAAPDDTDPGNNATTVSVPVK